MDRLLAEARNAASDPNYSADMGRAGGGDTSCTAGMKRIEDQFRAAIPRQPRGQARPLMELELWSLDARIELIRRECSESPNYRAERVELQRKYDEIMKACRAVSSSGTCAGQRP